MAHQINEAVLGDEDVVFEANSQVFLPDINTRLNSEAFLDSLVTANL